jgi:hypothetical protein
MVYYDSGEKELVILGGQIPTVGIYSIVVTASVKSATGYVCSTITFDLVVYDPEAPLEESTPAETQLCDQSDAVLTGLPTSKTFSVTSGQLFLSNLDFSDNKNGQCLSQWWFEFPGSDEPDTQISFSSTTKVLTFFTSRTDLQQSSASLKVVRNNNELI